MFIDYGEMRRGYRESQQLASGLYLALFTNDSLVASPGRQPLRACVRKVSLLQLGHFMSGLLRIGRHYIVVSGPIGHDGLPLDVRTPAYFKPGEPPHEIIVDWGSLVELPIDLRDTYWHNSGHNTVDGIARHQLNEWAVLNIEALRKAGKVGT